MPVPNWVWWAGGAAAVYYFDIAGIRSSLLGGGVVAGPVPQEPQNGYATAYPGGTPGFYPGGGISTGYETQIGGAASDPRVGGGAVGASGPSNYPPPGPDAPPGQATPPQVISGGTYISPERGGGPRGTIVVPSKRPTSGVGVSSSNAQNAADRADQARRQASFVPGAARTDPRSGPTALIAQRRITSGTSLPPGASSGASTKPIATSMRTAGTPGLTTSAPRPGVTRRGPSAVLEARTNRGR